MAYNNKGFFDEEATPSEWESINEGLENIGDVEEYSNPVSSVIERAEDVVDESYELEEEEFNTLNEARLRLEQARLYEMFLQHNLFDGVDGHPQAISTVQKELKEYILERLEILLGIRSDNIKYERPSEGESLDTEQIGFLKQLANKGMQRGLAPIAKTQSKTGLKSMGENTKHKVQTPSIQQTKKKLVKKTNKKNKQTRNSNKNQTIEEIARKDIEENKNRKPANKMTSKELLEYNKKISLKYKSDLAPQPGTLPMPTFDQQNALIEDIVSRDDNANSLAALINKHKGE